MRNSTMHHPTSSKDQQGETGERRARSHKGTDESNRMMMSSALRGRTPRSHRALSSQTVLGNRRVYEVCWYTAVGRARAGGRDVWTNMKNSSLHSPFALHRRSNHSIPKQVWGWGLINLTNSRPLPLGSRGRIPISQHSGSHTDDR